MDNWIKALKDLTSGKEQNAYDEKVSILLSWLEKELIDGDPYSVWKAVLLCTEIGCNYPDWVRFELSRISSGLLDIDQEITGARYPAYVSKVLGLKGKKRTEEAKRQNASRSIQCREMVREGLRRTDIVNALSQGLNRRDAEKIYDTSRHKKVKIQNLQKTTPKSDLFVRNLPPQE